MRYLLMSVAFIILISACNSDRVVKITHVEVQEKVILVSVLSNYPVNIKCTALDRQFNVMKSVTYDVNGESVIQVRVKSTRNFWKMECKSNG
jgi:hypothetical protein